MSLTNLQDNLRLLDMIEDDEDQIIDAIEMAWWDDESLINFALDYDKVKALEEDDVHSLIFELAKRLDNYILGADEPE